MTKVARQTPREAYLASLSSTDELAARRAAEKSGVPDDDPMWLLLAEVRRACSEVNQCTLALQQVAFDAAQRIEQSASCNDRTAAFEDAHIAQLASAAGAGIAKDPRVASAVASAVGQVEADATRALRIAEISIRDLTRRRSATPLASLIFALALGVTSCWAAIWSGYHTGVAYGRDLGYRAGFHDARLYDRSHQ
jgi:hypothetical protein